MHQTSDELKVVETKQAAVAMRVQPENSALKRATEAAMKLSSEDYIPKSMFISSFYPRD